MTLFFGIKVDGLFVFSKTTRPIYANFFSRLRKKHLLIITCIEKHCTLPALKVELCRIARFDNINVVPDSYLNWLWLRVGWYTKCYANFYA